MKRGSRLVSNTLVLLLTVLVFLMFAFVGTKTGAATLSKPTHVSCYAKTYNSVSLKWNKVKSAKSYVVYKYNDSAKEYDKISVTRKSSYKITGLKKGTSYLFVVKSAKTTGGTVLSKPSQSLSVTTYYPKSYTITTSSLPCNKKMLKYSYYTAQTKSYYTIRSYMELFEKCGGGTLRLTSGVYSVTNTIFVPSNVTIILDNGAKIVKSKKTGSGLSPSHSIFHLIRPSKGKKSGVVGGYGGEKNIVFKGSGNATMDMKSETDSNCIETGHNTDITITGIAFKNAKHGHFIELDACKSVTITDCNFTGIVGDDVREAINLDTPDKATGGYTAVWSKFDKTADYNVSISDCTFSNMGRSVGTHNYSYGHSHRHITITNCTMTGMRSYGIGLMYWEDSSITGNSITGSDTAMKSKAAGILGKGVTSCTIKNNTIDNYYYGMLFKSEKSSGYPEISNHLTQDEISNLNHNTADTTGFYYDNNDSDPIRLYFNR